MVKALIYTTIAAVAFYMLLVSGSRDLNPQFPFFFSLDIASKKLNSLMKKREVLLLK